MAKILALADQGFGKTISASGCKEPSLGIDIEGLDPKETYFISITSKPLPRRGSNKLFPIVQVYLNEKAEDMKARLFNGRRVVTTDGYLVAQVIDVLNTTPIKNIVIDDANYLMQDYMMEKSLQTGWDAPKKAGHFMSKVFSAMERAGAIGKNVIMLAHYEDQKKDNNGNVTFKMKTTGKTIDGNINPEGKFDIVLFGITEPDARNKKVRRFYLTNNDGTYPAKSAPGLFPGLEIPNDMGFVLKCVDAYYNDEETPKLPDNFVVSIPTVPVEAAPEVKETTAEEDNAVPVP